MHENDTFVLLFRNSNIAFLLCAVSIYFVFFSSFELTLADHSCIFVMATVVVSKLKMATLVDEVLSSSAHQVIQPNRTRPKTKSDVAINN